VKILLIRLRLIGDVVFTTPLVAALKRTFPNSRLTYLVEEHAAPIVAGNPHLAEVLVVPRTRGLARVTGDLRLASQLRAERFDAVLDLHGGPRSSWLTWATGAPRRIGYDIEGRSWHYTHTVHRPRGLQPRHSVANQWELLAALPGWPGDTPDPARDPAEMALDRVVDARIASRLAACQVDARHQVIVIHVSAGNPFRRWPEQAFATLTSDLAAGDACRRIILSAGPSDRMAADRIARSARETLGPSRGWQVLEFGDVDLQELRALVARSALYIGGDSGPLHVASTTTTPIVGIYGPTLSVRSKPWRDPRLATESVEIGDLPCRPCDQRVCAPGDFRCLTRIDAAAVVAAAERALAPTPTRVRLHS
jgi:lipopolysaccharide heptosyltransferase II